MEANRGIRERMMKGQAIALVGQQGSLSVPCHCLNSLAQYLSAPYILVRYIHTNFHPFVKTFFIVSVLLRLIFLHFILSSIFQILLFLHAQRPNNMRFRTLACDDRGKNKQKTPIKLKASSINAQRAVSSGHSCSGSSTQNETQITGRTMCLKS